MSSKPKAYFITLTANTFYSGYVRAESHETAISLARDRWLNINPHGFEQFDDELVQVEAEEVQP